VDIANYLLMLEKNKYGVINQPDNDLIYEVCKRGQYHILKLLLTTYNNIDVHFENDVLFKIACMHGHIETLRVIVASKDKHRDISQYAYEYGIIIATKSGHLHTVEFILSLFEDINFAFLNRMFLCACFYHRYHIAKFIMLYVGNNSCKLGEYDDLYNDSIDIIFLYSCVSNQIEIVKQLNKTNKNLCYEIRKNMLIPIILGDIQELDSTNECSMVVDFHDFPLSNIVNVVL